MRRALDDFGGVQTTCRSRRLCRPGLRGGAISTDWGRGALGRRGPSASARRWRASLLGSSVEGRRGRQYPTASLRKAAAGSVAAGGGLGATS